MATEEQIRAELQKLSPELKSKYNAKTKEERTLFLKKVSDGIDSALKTTESVKPNVESGGIISDLISGPGVDLQRGFKSGLQAPLKPAASILEFLNPVSGLFGTGAGEGGVPDKFNLPKLSIENLEREKQSLPKSTSHPAARAINELIGETPGIIAEFAQGGKIAESLGIGKGIAQRLGVEQSPKIIGSLSSSAEIALTQALENIKNGPTETAQAAFSGAGVGIAFPAAGKALEESFNLIKKGYKSTAENLLHLLTNNKAAAVDFVKNPYKYKLKFTEKGVKTVKEARAESARQLENLRNDLSKQTSILKNNQQAERDKLAFELQSSKDKLDDSINNAVSSFKEGKLNKLSEVSEATSKALEEERLAHATKVNSELGMLFENAKKLKDDEGEIVGQAIEDIVAIDPDAGIAKGVISRFVNPILRNAQKRGYFTIKKGAAVPVTSNQKALADKVNVFLNDIKKSKTEDGKVPLAVLNGLKNDARTIAKQAFNSGDNPTGVVFQELSKEINPANIASKDPVVGGALKNLREANKSFAKKVQPYNELSELMTSLDANGKVIVNPSSIINGVKNNDVAILNRLRNIDRQLPKDQRVLPVIRKHLSEVDKSITRQKSQLKAVKKALSEQEKKLAEKNVALKRNLRNQEKQKRIILRDDQKQVLESNLSAKNEQIKNLQKSIDDEINFLENQDDLRAFQGKGLTGLLQRVFAFGNILPFFSGRGGEAIGSAVGGLVPILGLSPNVQARLFRKAISTSKFLEGPVKESVSKSGVSKLLSKKAALKADEFLKGE